MARSIGRLGTSTSRAGSIRLGVASQGFTSQLGTDESRPGNIALGLGVPIGAPSLVIRTTTDSLSFAEVAEGSRVIFRTVTDALGLSDAATRIVTFLRSTTDSLSLADVATGLKVILRDATDSLTLADVVEGIKVIPRFATDTLGFSEAASRTGTFLRDVTQSITLADAVTRAKTAARSAADAISFSESAQGIISGYSRFATDALNLADSVTRSGTFFRAISDGLSLVDVAISSINGIFGPFFSAVVSTVKKTTALQIQTVRRHPPLSDFKKTRTKLDQARFDDTAWGLSGVGDIMGNISGNNDPIPDIGDLTVVIDATCDAPQYIIHIDDPNDPAPTTDSYAKNNTIYEELERVGNEFVPTFSVQFYRAVWFDGLEAYDPTHYDVGPTGNVIPNTVLIAGTVVTAQYIKGA